MLAVAALLISAIPPLRPGRYDESLAEGKLTRSYSLLLPAKADGKTKLPLVLVLHDWTGTAKGAEAYTQMASEGAKSGFVAAFPSGAGGGWNAGFKNLGADGAEDVSFIDHVISAIAKLTPIDPKRIFVVGHGNGGMMAYVLAGRLSERIAAIGVVEGSLGVDRGDVKGHAPRPDVPVSAIILHGKFDPNIPFDHGAGLTGRKPLMPDLMSALDSASQWARDDGISSLPKKLETKNPNLQIVDWKQGGVEVEFITIVNGAHRWPGGVGFDGPETQTGLNAADVIWEFLVAHPKT